MIAKPPADRTPAVAELRQRPVTGRTVTIVAAVTPVSRAHLGESSGRCAERAGRRTIACAPRPDAAP